MLEEINNFENLVSEKYRELKLIRLYDYQIDDKHSFTVFADIIRKKKYIKEFPTKYGFDLGFYGDFDTISNNLKYFIALCSIYQPFINNEHMEKSYRQNLYDSRYLLYISLGMQLIYNFWDRIGDLITFFYEVKSKSKRYYFVLIIDHLIGNFEHSENYKWLKEFKENNYQEIINIRHDIVHSFSLNSAHYEEFITIYTTDKSKLEDHYNKKVNYLKILKEHFDLFNIGFEKSLKLINELPNKQL